MVYFLEHTKIKCTVPGLVEWHFSQGPVHQRSHAEEMLLITKTLSLLNIFHGSLIDTNLMTLGAKWSLHRYDEWKKCFYHFIKKNCQYNFETHPWIPHTLKSTDFTPSRGVIFKMTAEFLWWWSQVVCRQEPSIITSHRNACNLFKCSNTYMVIEKGIFKGSIALLVYNPMVTPDSSPSESPDEDKLLRSRGTDSSFEDTYFASNGYSHQYTIAIVVHTASSKHRIIPCTTIETFLRVWKYVKIMCIQLCDDVTNFTETARGAYHRAVLEKQQHTCTWQKILQYRVCYDI